MKKIITIDNNKKIVKINVNPMFYPREYVEQACEDYEKIVSTKISLSRKNIRITLKPKKSVELGVLGFEFMNYLLSLSKEGI